MRSRIVIYTAIYGGFDELLPQPSFPGVDYVCFSDRSIKAPGWEVVIQRPRYEIPRLAAKHFKTRPHRMLWRWPVSIWIDGNVVITAPDFVQQCVERVRGNTIALFPHPDRSNIASEAQVLSAEVLSGITRFVGLPFAEQVANYLAEGYPDEVLYACTMLVRRHRRNSMRRFGNAWMTENLHWTFRDQLSFPYVAWKHGVTPETFPYNLWENPLFTIKGHAFLG